jgi:hypothetical protein
LLNDISGIIGIFLSVRTVAQGVEPTEIFFFLLERKLANEDCVEHKTDHVLMRQMASLRTDALAWEEGEGKTCHV